MMMEILRKIYAFLIDTLQSLLMAAAVFLVIYQFFLRPFEVKGDSMYPNFHDGSFVLTNVLSIRLTNPRLGDVIVFKAPPDPEKAFIKRVIGVPGDNIKLETGNVYLNGRLLNENAYLKPSVKTYGGAFIREGQIVTVPSNSFFVLGDNRPFSSDSREWGFVKKENCSFSFSDLLSGCKIAGYSFFVYWPIKEMKLIENPFK